MIHEIKKIKTCDGIELNARVKESGAKKWIIQLHDYGDHVGRNEYVFEYCSEQYNILQFDLRGHGDSQGNLSKIEDFRILTRDLDDALNYLRKEYRMEEFVFVAQGLGALIVCDYIQNFSKKEFYPDNVFLIAPMLFLKGFWGRVWSYTDPIFFKTWRKITFDFPLPGFIDSKKLSHDGRVFQKFIKDPKIKKSISQKFLNLILLAARDIITRPLRCDCKLTIVCGSQDDLIDLDATKSYFERFEKGSKLEIIDGAYREVHHEVDQYSSQFREILKENLLYKEFSMKII